MKVVSCTRTATGDGYSFIQAVVELKNDGNMKNVNEHVRLHFSFLREPQHRDGDEDVDDNIAGGNVERDQAPCEGEINHETAKRKRGESLDDHQSKKLKHSNSPNDNECGMEDDDSLNQEPTNGGFRPKTIITYKIECSVDWDKLEKLFGVDVYAAGEFPSIEEAIPIMDGDDTASDNNSTDDRVVNGNKHDNANKQNDEDRGFEEVEMSSNDDQSDNGRPNNNDDADRFGVFVDPENILTFLNRLNMNFNEQSVFHFLLMFPFYEHEWDISGFLLSSLFDDDSDGDVQSDSEEKWDGAVCVPCPSDEDDGD